MTKPTQPWEMFQNLASQLERRAGMGFAPPWDQSGGGPRPWRGDDRPHEHGQGRGDPGPDDRRRGDRDRGDRDRGRGERRGGPRGPWGRGGPWAGGGPWGGGPWGSGHGDWERGWPVDPADLFGPDGPFGGHGRRHGPRGRGRGERGRRPRARRGDIRSGILHLLAERAMHGYEMLQELESRSQGLWKPSAGSIYPTLQLLEDEGKVASEERDGKKLYVLTDAGRAEVEASASAPWRPFAEYADRAEAEEAESPWHDFRTAMLGAGMAAMQAAQAGSPEQLERVLEILRDTRARIYRVLGEDARDDDPDAGDDEDFDTDDLADVADPDADDRTDDAEGDETTGSRSENQ